MVLMMALPAASWSYAVRTVVTAALLVWSVPQLVGAASCRTWGRQDASPTESSGGSGGILKDLSFGFAAGLLVLLIWIAPDGWSWYRQWCVIGNPYGENTVAPASLNWLVWLQLFGSAFVISAAEELFFRKWLIRFAGFGWMVALFAVEHDRWLVGAIAGVIYGLIYLKRGTFAAIVAHATTNLLLGLYVICFNHWEFW